RKASRASCPKQQASEHSEYAGNGALTRVKSVNSRACGGSASLALGAAEPERDIPHELAARIAALRPELVALFTLETSATDDHHIRLRRGFFIRAVHRARPLRGIARHADEIESARARTGDGTRSALVLPARAIDGR